MNNKDGVSAQNNASLMVIVVWLVMLISNLAPNIIISSLFDSVPLWLVWIKVILLASLLIAIRQLHSLRVLQTFFIVLITLNLGMFFIDYLSLESIPLQKILGGDVFVETLQPNQAGKLIMSGSVLLILLALRYRCDDLRLRWSDIHAPIKPVPILGFPKPDSWISKANLMSIIEHTKKSDTHNVVTIGSHHADWSRLVTTCLLIMIACTGCTSYPADSTDNPSDVIARLDHLIPDWITRYDVPGLRIAIIDSGELVWSQAYGYKNVEDQIPMTTETVFRVESISKSVTAWGVMYLVEDGVIDLDVPIQQYLSSWRLPESAYAEETITTRMLLSHSSGLALGNFNDEYDPRDVVPELRDTLYDEVDFVYEPDSDFLYSNAGYHILQVLVEDVTGSTFEAYMSENILRPLGMNYASFTWENIEHHNLATGYELNHSPVDDYVYPAQSSGGLFATVDDIAVFLMAGMTSSDQQILSADTIQQLYTPQITTSGIYGIVSDAYAMGYFVEDLPCNTSLIWHGGQGHGWMTHFHINPASGDGIVILTNSQRSYPLIASILEEWSDWSSYPTVKMTRIIQASRILRGLIALLIAVDVYLICTMLREVYLSQRIVNPFRHHRRMYRLLSLIFGCSLLALLWWGMNQPYLFVTTIFPDLASWIVIVSISTATASFLYALFPVRQESAGISRFDKVER